MTDTLKNINFADNLKPAKKMFDVLYLIGLFIVAIAGTLRTVYIYPGSYISFQTAFFIISPFVMPIMFLRFITSGTVSPNVVSFVVFGVMMFFLFHYGFFSEAFDYRYIMLIMAIGGVGLPVKSVMKVVFAAEVIGMIVTPIAYFFGQTTMQYVVFYREDARRYTFGFAHPNHLAIEAFMLAALFLYLVFDNLKLWHLIVTEVFGIIIFILTNGRGGFLFTTLAVILFGVYKFLLVKKQFDIFDKKYIRIIAVAAFPIFTVISFLFIPLANIPLLDTLSSGRMSLSAAAVSDYGVGFLSQVPPSEGIYILDNYYIYTSVHEGLLLLLLYGVLFVLFMNRAVRVNRPLVILVGTMLCFMLLENIFRWYCFTPVAPLILSGASALTFSNNERTPLAKAD